MKKSLHYNRIIYLRLYHRFLNRFIFNLWPVFLCSPSLYTSVNSTWAPSPPPLPPTGYCGAFARPISPGGGVGLDTNITKNRLNMFPEIPDFFLKISKFFSKYLKNIWLHVINITVTTQQYSLSSKMATQISVNFRKLYSCTAYNKTKTISHKVNLIYSALQPPRRLGHCTLIQAEFVKDHEVLEV